MKPIKLFFAGSVNAGLATSISNAGVRNRLVTYAYPREFQVWLETIPQEGSVIIDSGAFSAWNRGKHISIKEYITYCQQCLETAKEYNKTIHVVNLDVIPGKAGGTKALNACIGSEIQLKQNKDLINSAAARGFQNLKRMKREGITPIHVYHQGEDWRWLEKMVEQTDYIGISPANDMPSISKKKWIYSVFEYMYKRGIEVRTHGFAVWVFDLMKELPWTSCDAATWLISAGLGNVYIPNGGYTDTIDFSRGSSSFFQLRITDRDEKTASEALDSVVETTGFSYDELKVYKNRFVVNCKFFLAMEKWLNGYKETNDYKPKSSLL